MPNRENENHFKLLLDHRQIINKKEFPNDFKVVDFDNFYEFPFEFHIKDKEEPTIDESKESFLRHQAEEKADKEREYLEAKWKQFHDISETL